MCLQTLVNIHHCVFKILEKHQFESVTDGHTDRRTDNEKTVYHTTNKVCEGYNDIYLYIYIYIYKPTTVMYLYYWPFQGSASVVEFVIAISCPLSVNPRIFFFFLLGVGGGGGRVIYVLYRLMVQAG